MAIFDSLRGVAKNDAGDGIPASRIRTVLNRARIGGLHINHVEGIIAALVDAHIAIDDDECITAAAAPQSEQKVVAAVGALKRLGVDTSFAARGEKLSARALDEATAGKPVSARLTAKSLAYSAGLIGD